ncbi:hypothetical protein [Curtobacterium sp. VKM Ac-1376]|uniref:hypothetical protein n=1 Tax=Curtobacterium sp. VKM Ac-1376 TaxID=123312 RepID=UPI00188D564B|nr:hypothetical protein [Curtobacterium sp. VKM Ac-1376]MBF4616446.1 hypothetical protein [Curtobacterium sp. VKM Ac-1376]
MSILLHHPNVSPAAQAVLGWATADDGFWVADHRGAFAGTIDQQGRHFFVRNGFGEYIGDYRTFRAAQTALTDRVLRVRAAPSC